MAAIIAPPEQKAFPINNVLITAGPESPIGNLIVTMASVIFKGIRTEGKIDVKELMSKIKLELPLVVIDTNHFGHIMLAGYEYLGGKPDKKRREAKKRDKTRKNKLQGDGTCFNTAVEPLYLMNISIGGKIIEKKYQLKLLGGDKIQIPGIRDVALADALYISEHLCNALTKATEVKHTLPKPSVLLKNFGTKIKVPAGHSINIALIKERLCARKDYPRFEKFDDNYIFIILCVIADGEHRKNEPKLKIFRDTTAKNANNVFMLGAFTDTLAKNTYDIVSGAITLGDVFYKPK